MNESRERAARLQLDACLAECAGVVPSPTATERLVERLRAESVRQARWHAGLAAVVLVAGGLIAWAFNAPAKVERDAGQGDSGQSGQDAAPVDQKAIERLLKLFEVGDLRMTVWRDLDAMLPAGAASVSAQLAAAQIAAKHRPELLAAYADLAAVMLPRLASANRPVTGPSVLYTDYAENEIVEVSRQTGKRTSRVSQVFGPWDVDVLTDGTLLVTEFSLSRVRKLSPSGETLWTFEGLKNPYRADPLPNGNVLIADTFNSRVIEVDAAGTVVWSHAGKSNPFDVQRLGNGNTLIAYGADGLVQEISPAGQVIWQADGFAMVHDVDRLLNGHTLITSREDRAVVELDVRGREVWALRGLDHPNCAERLPNGNTLVAGSGSVREYSPAGEVVWQIKVSWAMDAVWR